MDFLIEFGFGFGIWIEFFKFFYINSLTNQNNFQNNIIYYNIVHIIQLVSVINKFVIRKLFLKKNLLVVFLILHI